LAGRTRTFFPLTSDALCFLSTPKPYGGSGGSKRLDSGSCRHILKGRLVEKLPSYRKILTLRKESNRTKKPQKGLQKKDFGDGGASKTPWLA